MLNIDTNDVTNHKSIADVDLGFAINYELQLLKKSGKATDTRVYNFKSCSAIFIKIVQSCVRKVSTQVIICQMHAMFYHRHTSVKCPESCILMYEKILTKLVEYNIIAPNSADVSELLYHKFLSTVVKEIKKEFMKFDNAMQRLDVFPVEVYWRIKQCKDWMFFLWKFIGG